MERLMAAQQHAQLVRLAAAEAAAAAGGVVGDSDSVAHMQLQQQGTIDLQHAASFALGSPGTQHHMLLGSLTTAQHAAELEAAAAAGPGTGSGGGSSRDQRDQRAGRRRSHAATLEATGTSRGGESDDERVKRRREINRNSQKRIRERRNKEMDGLKTEVSTHVTVQLLSFHVQIVDCCD
jgi:hypothetical protein